LQKLDCDPALDSQAADFAIAKFIVVVPAIKAWMKQRRELSGLGIYNCPPAVLHCDHVINLVLRERESL
jgi:hypothetical protein